ACYPAACLALGATIQTSADRAIHADDFFQGMFDTALDEGELIVSIDFPVPQAAAYQKFLQPASHFAMVGVFVARFADGVRVAVTGASEGGVFRWSDAEAALSANFAPEAVASLSASAEGMIGDIHATPAYRAHLIGVMTKRAVADAA
ncbi:MAG: FAD binding domain-containing protein, partial [Pseudomonadota bacterium]